MMLNNIDKLDIKKGEWVILGDFISEGFGVIGQYKTAEEAIMNFGQSGSSEAIIKLVNFEFTIVD